MYGFSALLSLGSFVFAFTAAFPEPTRAFWPFGDSASAAERGTIVHDPSIGLLSAAINQNPDPIKVGEGGTTLSGSALIADSGPAGTLADVASSTPSSDQISLYVVRSGDTLSVIANMFRVSVNTIVLANNLGSARTIRPGQTLIVLPVSGVIHTVAKGDTLQSIAKKYRVNAGDIADYNSLDADSPIEIGLALIVPGGDLSIPVSSGTNTIARSGGKIYEPYLGGSGAEISGYFSNPIPGAILTQKIHGWNGIDLGAARGTAVHAAASGVVVSATSGWSGGYGNNIVIVHDNGVRTRYAHLSRILVQVGSAVSNGQVIGTVGNTGLSTGPHLHFEVLGAMNPFASCRERTVCEPR